MKRLIGSIILFALIATAPAYARGSHGYKRSASHHRVHVAQSK